MARVDQSALDRWRTLDAALALAALADHAKADASYRPVKSRRSSRWHASVNSRNFELLITGPRFWDTRAQIGGGGAIDLAIHVARVDFKGAVRLLKRHKL